MHLIEHKACGCEWYLVGTRPLLRACRDHAPITQAARVHDGEDTH